MSYLSLGDKDDNEDFFGSPPMGGQSSSLGSLFGMSAQMDNNAGSNQSLTYTAKKPPKPDKGQKTEAAENKKGNTGGGVAAAAAITAYRYVGNQYKPQGKLGMALLSNFAERDFKILMYVSKQQPVTTAKIYAEFQFNVQLNNYASFYDDQRQSWSILFGDAEQLSNFAKQVCLAKFHCQTQPNIVIQDVVLGEADTQVLTSGDSVEAKYTGWLVQSQTGALGTVFDSNHKTDKTFRFKTGKGKVIRGWEEGMLGMKKGGKRFLVIPPAYAYGSKGAGSRVPPNSTLAFEVDILRLKHQNADSVQASNSTDSVPQTLEQGQPTANFGSALEAPFTGMPGNQDETDETVKGRTASFNERMSQNESKGDSTKAKLLSRMAKVGQPMLPLQPSAGKSDPPAPNPIAQNPDFNQASIQHQVVNDPSRSPMSYSPGPTIQGTVPMMLSHSDYQRIAANRQVASPMPAQIMNSGSVATSFHPAGIMSYSEVPRSTYTPIPQYPLPSSDLLPTILIESQSSKTILKSLVEKVDDVSEKISKLKTASETNANSMNHSMEIMDANQLSFNINRIIQENERVKKQILERDRLVQTQSDKITDLLQQNQKLMEESHDQMAKRNVSFQERFGQSQEKTMQLEQEKLELTNKLSEATAKICQLQINLKDTSEKASSLEKVVQASSSQHENELKIQQLESQLSSVKGILAKTKHENENLRASQQKNEVEGQEAGDKLKAMQQEFSNEKERLNNEIESLKLQHQTRMQSMQEKHQSDSNEFTEIRSQLETSWKEKCKEMVSKVSEAAKEKISELESEKDVLMKKLESFQDKMLQLKGMYEQKVKLEESLKEELSEFETMKQRHESLRKQAMAMKQKYEATIVEMREKLQQQSEEGSGHDDVNAEIKSVMNNVFQEVCGKISTDSEYSGGDVIGIVRDIIRSTTLSLLSDVKTGSDEEEEIEDSESDEESQNDDSNEEEEGAPIVQEEPVKDSSDPEGKTEECTPEDQNEKEDKKDDEDQQVKDDTESQKEEVESDVKLDEAGQTSAGTSEDQQAVEDLPQQQPNDNNTSDDVQESQNDQENAVSSNKEVKVESSPTEQAERARSTSSDAPDKPSPPPLFDDDDEDDDLDWLN